MYVVKAHVEAGRHREEIKLALVSAARRGTPCTQPSNPRPIIKSDVNQMRRVLQY